MILIALFFQLLFSTNAIADLETFQNWQFCTQIQNNETCSPIKPNENIQHKLSSGHYKGTYRTQFSNDKCKVNGCWMFIGEGADNIKVSLNGSIILTQDHSDGTPFYTRYMSNSVFLPNILIKNQNTIEIEVKDLNETIFGVRTSSIDLGSFSEIAELQFFDFIKRTGLTLLSFYSLLVIFSAMFFLSIMTKSLGVGTLALYSGAAAIYLLSFSEIPRSYFDPVFTSGPMHFVLRLFQDFTLTILIGFYFRGKRFPFKNAIVTSYSLAMTSQFALWLFGDHTYKPFLYLMYGLSPLIFFPTLYGFILSLRFNENLRIKRWIIWFFALMMTLQINDLFSFWQLYKGFFFVRFYPNIIVVIFTLLYIERELKNRTKIQKEILIASLATQLSHDIRSPLAALEMLSGSLNEIPEDKRLIVRNSINRIRDISNSLLDKNRTMESSEKLSDRIENSNTIEMFTVNLLSPLIDSLITEKRLQYRNHLGIRIDFTQTRESYGLFASIQQNEFQRVLSNLIDNSVESLQNHQGTVELSLQSNTSNQILLTVKDNGKGIPENILPKLGIRGETHGKENGSGLGLFHAKETIEASNGSLNIESKVGAGTTITLALPLQKSPAWFVPKISLTKDQTLIVFDDDQSIHQIWKGRLESLPNHSTINVRHFAAPEEFRKFYSKNFSELESALFLMDFEITGSNESGLDLIETLGIQKQSILVTSRYEEKNIRERCEAIGVRLIPKNMSGFVPMEIIS